MSNNDLIKNYKTEKVNVEMDINREEDNLLKYQLKKDYSAVKNCRERLENLYSTLRNIENKIEELENGTGNTLANSFNVPTNLPKQRVSDIPIDDGTATFTFTATKETSGTKDGKNIHTSHEQTVQQTIEVVNGDIVSKKVTETSTTHKEIKNSEDINTKAKLLK